MRPLQRLRAARYLAFLLCGMMTYGSAPAGFEAAIFASWSAFQQRPVPEGFTTAPGPVELGANPSRDPIGRSGVWNERRLEALREAALRWGASPERIGAVANTNPSARPPVDPEDPGGGATFPWEAPYSVSPHILINTNTGNVRTQEFVLSFPSIAGTGVAVTLYHNSQSTFEGAFSGVGRATTTPRSPHMQMAM